MSYRAIFDPKGVLTIVNKDIKDNIIEQTQYIWENVGGQIKIKKASPEEIDTKLKSASPTDDTTVRDIDCGSVNPIVPLLSDNIVFAPIIHQSGQSFYGTVIQTVLKSRPPQNSSTEDSTIDKEKITKLIEENNAALLIHRTNQQNDEKALEKAKVSNPENIVPLQNAIANRKDKIDELQRNNLYYQNLITPPTLESTVSTQTPPPISDQQPPPIDPPLKTPPTRGWQSPNQDHSTPRPQPLTNIKLSGQRKPPVTSPPNPTVSVGSENNKEKGALNIFEKDIMKKRKTTAEHDGIKTTPLSNGKGFKAHNDSPDENKKIEYVSEYNRITSNLTNDATLKEIAKNITLGIDEIIKNPAIKAEEKLIYVNCKDKAVEKKLREFIQQELQEKLNKLGPETNENKQLKAGLTLMMNDLKATTPQATPPEKKPSTPMNIDPPNVNPTPPSNPISQKRSSIG